MADNDLSPSQRDLAQKLGANPLDMFASTETRGWLEDLIRQMLPTKAGAFRPPVGFSTVILKDLTAQTAAYVYTDADGIEWLYCNGVAVSQTTYADLYAFFGANAFAADGGGNFTLPDCRGRAMFMCGTNAATQRNDNDGVAVASRQANHSPANGATITGAPGVGTLAVASHTHDVSSLTFNVSAGSGGSAWSGGGTTSGATAPAVTGAPSAGTLAVGGTIGSGMTGDGPAHLFVGSLLVRF